MSSIVIDGKLPPAEIVKQIIEAAHNGVEVSIRFDSEGDNDAAKREINGLLERINQTNFAAMMAEDIEKLRRPPALEEGNRKARRAAATKRRGKR